MRKIEVFKNRILKLTNVLIKEVELQEPNDIKLIVDEMERFMLLRGGQPIGPLVQYTEVIVNNDGESKMITKLMRQCNKFIKNTDGFYRMESVIRCKNCMYARFNGEEHNVRFAYDKITVTAYEEEIKLKGNSYTVFINNEDYTLSADIFMECISND